MSKTNEFKTGRNCVSKLHCHLVFITKYRYSALQGYMYPALKNLFESVCKDFESELVEFNGEADHIHLLVHYPPKVSLAKLVNSLRGGASRRLNQHHPEVANRYYKSALWSPGYFAASCGGAPIELIKQYMKQQRTPH